MVYKKLFYSTLIVYSPLQKVKNNFGSVFFQYYLLVPVDLYRLNIAGFSLEDCVTESEVVFILDPAEGVR